MAIVLMLVLLTAHNAFAGPVIGAARTVVRDVQGIVDASLRTLVIDDNIHQQEKIKTGPLSATRLVFSDQTDFMVGPNAEVVLDKFIFDNRPGKGKLFLKASRGLLKFRTGTMPSSSYQIKTPTATVGVRGTEFALHVLPDGTSYVFVLSGKVILTDNDGMEKEVLPGESGIVYPNGHERSGYGPIHFRDVQPAFEDDVRRMVSLIVFHEDATDQEASAQFFLPDPIRLRESGLEALPLFAGGGGGSQGFSSNGELEFEPNVKVGIAAPPVIPKPVLAPVYLPNTFFRDPGLESGVSTLSGTSSPPPVPPPELEPTFDGYITNGGFEAGDNSWNSVGPGTFEIVPLEMVDGVINHVGELTTGSPITIYSEIDTPQDPFVITFDVDFLDEDGVLEILINGEVIQTYLPDHTEGLTTYEFLVTDPTLIGLTDAELSFHFDASEAGRRLHLDNITVRVATLAELEEQVVVATPSPAPLALLPLGLVAVRLVRRSRRMV